MQHLRSLVFALFRSESGLVLAAAGVLLALAGLVWLIVQRRRDQREQRRMEEARRVGLHIPASLHPVIDPQICIGSAACVAACPEGDVLGLVGGAGRLIHGAACIGHGRCAAECPVDAIKLVFGTEERGTDIPSLTADFETNRQGLYIAGELGGMGLIRNAMRQGIGAARHATANLDRKLHRSAVDVAIVGAGPAGLGAALACLEAGASYRLIEQDTFGGTVAHYPRQKLVMTAPIDVPLFGRVHRSEMTKEELLALWHEVVAETQLEVQEGVRMLGVDGDDNHFEVTTSQGVFAARKVILAIGRRGTPRRLEVPGEDLPHVTYNLTDAAQYRGRAVMVVGGGDSALEAASALCDEAGTHVTLVYRGEGFFRAKEKNRTRIEQLAGSGKLQVRLQSQPTHLLPGRALLEIPGGQTVARADSVIVSIGGEPPTALLAALRVRVDRWFGKVPEGHTASTRVAVSNRRAGLVDWLTYAFLVLGVGVLTAFGVVGYRYYHLSAAAREASPWHQLLRSSGVIGHGVGIIATVVMLTNFAYAARKRLRPLRHLGTTREWLNAHVIVGLLTPAFIAFHAAFQINNAIARTTYSALAAVVVTGIIGRFLYSRMRHGAGLAVLGYLGVRRLMSAWRAIHVLLALLMVATIVLHVAVSWLLGYRWLF
ncbi:MAG: NAD(P)-binding domain-containing protein [Myxococcota bacterium]